jgi:type I restriction-modification system DNA methylase subunit
MKTYEYQSVDLDVWKIVYQEFLSTEQINKLGFVTTPDQIVELILDLVGYDQNRMGLCNETILDPACGSGTFLVEALLRLLKHLEKNMPCHKHKPGTPKWEEEKTVLETVTKNIHGVDIHPFATFLTTLNLTFLTIDLYANVAQHYPGFGLEQDIATHDALSDKPTIQAPSPPYTNARFQEKMQRTKHFADLLDQKFNFVVGNPPWGAVLKGVMGPLGEAASRDEYKKRYESATGKYDIFVLFMERGIKWLKQKGKLGMITQVSWVSQGFGKGIKNIMKHEGTPRIFVDMQEVGGIIFPDWTNYPAITILERGNTSNLLQQVYVSKS